MKDQQGKNEAKERKLLSRRNMLLSLGAAGAAMALGGIKPGAVQAAGGMVLINVKDLGAKGNGRYDEDDAPYIQSAINRLSESGGIVYVPKGIYILKSSLRLSSGISLVGAGMEATILKAGSTYMNIIAGYQASQAVIQHLSFQGQGSFTLADHPNVECGIMLQQAEDVHISYCGFKMIVNGVKSQDSDSVKVENCRFDNIIGLTEARYEGFGIWVSGGKRHNVANNKFSRLFRPCITLTDGNSHSVVMNNYMENCYNFGIDLRGDTAKDTGLQQHLLTGNVISHISNPSGKKGYASGICLSGNSFLNIIMNNILSNIEESGIVLEGAAIEEVNKPRNNRIEGNIVKSVKSNGILLINANDNSVQSNDIQYTGGEGILVDTLGKGIGAVCKNNRITNNHIIHAHSAAIRLSGSGCQSTTLLGNVGSGNKEGIIDKGINTITASL